MNKRTDKVYNRVLYRLVKRLDNAAEIKGLSALEAAKILAVLVKEYPKAEAAGLNLVDEDGRLTAAEEEKMLARLAKWYTEVLDGKDEAPEPGDAGGAETE